MIGILCKIGKELIAMKLTKLVAAAAAAVLAVGMTTALPQKSNPTPMPEAAAAGKYNYGEALQKSLFFYEVQQAGPLPEWNSVSWRADSHVTDPIQGGWYDAGDHFKFSNTIAYSATLLGWGLHDYMKDVKDVGLYTQYANNLKWGLDYLVACDRGKEFVYCIGPLGGDGSFDHKWWGSAEVYMQMYYLKEGVTARDAHTGKNCAVAAQMATALAVGASVFEKSEPALAKKYLEKAQHYFDISYENRGSWKSMTDGGDTPAMGQMYKNTSFWDDLFLAANWLYVATGDKSYLDFCEKECIPNVPKEGQIDSLTFQWGYCWDHVWPAAFLMYAKNTGDPFWAKQVQNHLDYWTTGYMGTQIKYTPDGLAWLFNWGALRHATTTAFLAFEAVESIFKDDPALVDKYTKFAEKQINYALGDNAKNFSYVIGMGDKYPQGWHHRTSSGVWDDKWSALGSTKEHAHILYGALVGGPDQAGGYSDSPGDYQYSEVSIDYNAGYTAALCSMIARNGGKIDPKFPPTEEPKWDEFYVDGVVSQNANNHTAVKLEVHNHSAWPARLYPKMSFNYYVDLSEAVAAGIDPMTVKGNVTYVGPPVGPGDLRKDSNPTMTGPFRYKDDIYYFKVPFDGTLVLPAGQSEERWEFQFRIGWADGVTNPWDGSNDPSFIGLGSGTDKKVTKNITLYDGDRLVWGIEPDGTTPKPTEKGTVDNNKNTEQPTPTASVNKKTVYGDVNEDGEVTIDDVVMVRLFLMNSQKYPISMQAEENAKVIEGQGSVQGNCAVTIQDFVVEKIKILPLKP